MNTMVKKKIYTAKYDKMFKAIFISDDYELIEALISDCLGEKVKVVKFLNTELGVNKKDEKAKRLDVLVKTKDKYLNIEINTNYNKAIRVRNFNYFTAFYSSVAKEGEKYDYETEFIHIDLSFGMSNKELLKDEYMVYSNNSKKNYVENFKIIVYNMDKLKEVWYDGGRKGIEKYKHLLMIDLQPEELDKLGIDHVVSKYKERLLKMNDIDTYIPPVSPEEDYIKLRNTEIAIAKDEGREEGREEGRKEGRKEGIKEGIREGIEQKNIDVIKNLYNAGVDTKTIAIGVNMDENKVIDIIKSF